MIVDEKDYLAHYGILRRSGRYPWGSGGPETGGNKNFLDYESQLKKEGMSEVDRARIFGTTVQQLRAAKSIARAEQTASDAAMAQRLKEKGMSNPAIAERMFGSRSKESTVRNLLAPGAADKKMVLDSTADMLKRRVEAHGKEPGQSFGMIDVGAGVEHHAGVSRQKFDSALAKLQEEGYAVRRFKLPQVIGKGQMTEMKVLVPEHVTQKEAWMNRHNTSQLQSFSDDGGRSYFGIHEPLSIDSKRVGVLWKEDGGNKADGVIYVRPGVHDTHLGGNRYAQVRIMVDGTHYIKGMARYDDNLPPGIDLLVNSNKSRSANKLDAFKPIKDDPDNPFGAVIRQMTVKDEHGVERVTSVMNMVGSPQKEGSGAEGQWDTWSKNLSSQFLSKQTPKLAKEQLDMTYEKYKNQIDAIKRLTNPAVRRTLLEKAAETVDSSANHLEAAALPRQKNRVILPLESLKESEVYAPGFRNGERVILIRHPHGGTFELPELTVNNKHPQAKKILGDAEDAIMINHKVAERLSGADFDGDSVIVVPNSHGKITTTRGLEELKGFDHKASFPKYPGMKVMDSRETQQQMGSISNLITDMTIAGAPRNELARAIKHSMVVIDAEKHELNWRESARVHGIPDLKQKYQGKKNAGASTLISRAGAEKRVPQRKQGFRIDKETGTKIYRPTGRTYVDKNGKVQPHTDRSTKLAETADARTLISTHNTKIEQVYATHSNKLKALANETRREAVNTPPIVRSPSARETYHEEVKSLDSKLRIAQRNAPLERQAQVYAQGVLSAKKAANPNMTDDQYKKAKTQALAEGRTRVGAKKTKIEITDSEWEAIQSGAISNSKVTDILKHTDLDAVKERATPQTKLLMTSSKTSRAKSMLAQGYTEIEVADALGVSLTTLKTSLGGG